MNSKAPSAFDLTPEGKQRFVEELDRRKKALQAKPESALTWEELKERVRRSCGR
jgi:putative addiction module component (TIGR02574 family)